MSHILVLGAGRQGRAAALDLLSDGDTITCVDRDSLQVEQALEYLNLPQDRGHVADLSDPEQLAPFFDAADGAVFAADYALNVQLTKSAIANNCHAIDYGGNHDIVNEQHAMDDDAKAAGVAIVPDCGLTPGLAGVLVAGGIDRLDNAHRAEIRVGGLPLKPEGPLQYALVFSVRGLTNEYLEPSTVIEKGQVTTKPSLTGTESLTVDGRQFEAFYTSGGVSTLPRSFGNVLRHLDCKTIRYPGHAAKMRFLFEMGFGNETDVLNNGMSCSPREMLEKMLEFSLPHDPPDEVLMRVTVVGDGHRRIIYNMKDVYDENNQLTAMQRTTAWPGSRILKMLLDGTIEERGVLFQEKAVDADQLIRQLGERGIRIDVVEK